MAEIDKNNPPKKEEIENFWEVFGIKKKNIIDKQIGYPI